MNIIPPLPKGFVLWSKQYRYTIKDVIGRGSYGIVYLAELHSDVRNYTCNVALKEFAPVNLCTRQQDMSISLEKSFNEEVSQSQFTHEFYTLSHIDNYNVICVYENMHINGTLYYSMEYLKGGTLREYISRTGETTEERAIFIIKQIASGLEAFHQKGYFHNDLKLDNLVLRNDDCVIIIDGGVDFEYKSKDQTMIQISKIRDIYSLACVLLCLITGEAIERPEHPMIKQMLDTARHRMQLSDNIMDAIMLAFYSRFSDINDFINALEGNYYPQINTSIISPEYTLNRAAMDNNPKKALAFLEKMKRMPSFYISDKPIDTANLEPKVRNKFNYPNILEKIIIFFRDMQKGFVLGLRLPSPEEYSEFFRSSDEAESGTYIAFDPKEVKFFKIFYNREKNGLNIHCQRFDELRLFYDEENFKFYYACDTDPLIPSTQSIHAFAVETQLSYSTILPASMFGLCPVSFGNKWGMANKWDWVSTEVHCQYDRISDVKFVSIPGGVLKLFLGIIATVGEQIDVYELVAYGRLKLKISLTTSKWAELCTYT